MRAGGGRFRRFCRALEAVLAAIAAASAAAQLLGIALGMEWADPHGMVDAVLLYLVLDTRLRPEKEAER